MAKQLFIAIFLSISLVTYAQNTSDTIPLSQFLKQIEAQFNVSFSFADKTIANKTIKISERFTTLKEALDYLKSETKLNYKLLNERFITISKPSEIDQNPTYKLQRLDEVVVNNFLSQGLSKSINGAITIESDKFQILPGLIEPDILQTIQALPGITSAEELISDINIRGGTHDQNLILFDGMRMYQSGHFFGLISAFNPYLTETVDVTKNGTQAKHGSGVSGLIDIQSSNDRVKYLESGFGIDLIKADAFAKIPINKKSELQIAGQRSYTDVILSPTYDSYFERIFDDSELNSGRTITNDDDFFFYDVTAKYIYDLNSSTKITGNFVTIFNSLNYKQTTRESDNSELQTESDLKQTSYAGSLSFSKAFNKSLKGFAQVYFSNYQLNGFNNIITNNQLLTQSNTVDDLGIRLDLLKALDKNLNVNLGYQFNEVGVRNLEDVNRPRFKSSIKEVIRTHGVYTEAEFTSNSKNTYGRIGLRGNYIDKFGSIFFEPRLSFNQKFLDHFRLELLAETKHQSISQIIDLQQDFFGIEKRRWQLSNDEDVPIIKSSQVSAGLSYNRNGWLTSIEGYYKVVDGISSRSQGFQNQFQFTPATGKYTIKGIDVFLQKRFDNWSSWLSYSFSKNDYEFESLNNGQAFPSNIDLRHVANVSLSYNLNNFRIATGLNWHTGRPYTEPSDLQNERNTISYNTPNEERLNDYLRLDVSASYKFQLGLNTTMHLATSIWNLTNEANEINRYFTLNNNNDIVENTNFALRFTPNLNCRIHFN
ncbi:TonB-dependent receptor plug domain-containing protein [Winogradskyella maritima]|uniref:TonB-dependent receptor domain-containing protein n=1 Tax=Winogradskyella maritima TaxID=1517766 RepID=A0ABV8AL09_9FLAO|nr:TonB-dependent receptor plug domain-containing protein [Winogradskyella maritima]